MEAEQRSSESMLESQDPCYMDSAALTTAYRRGTLSPVDVARATLGRAEEIQTPFNAFTFLNYDGALSAAKESEKRWRAGEPLSPIDGVPTTIKDIVHVEGWAVRYGSLTTANVLMAQDAPSVSRLRKAGAVFIGQTTTPEYGWKAVTDSRAFGVTRNPWNPSLTPGGSSGGAAVAAACGAGVLHLGTDGGGSIRIPAAFTGIVGHKPTFGRVAADPPSSFGTVAHIGPMTRTVADAALMLEIISGRDLRDWNQPPMPFPAIALSEVELKGKRIGYWRTPCVGQVQSKVAAVTDRVVAALGDWGAAVTVISLPFQEELLDVFNRHWCVGAANRLAQIDPAKHNDLDPEFIKAARIGASFTSVERMAAEVKRSQYGAAMDRLLSDFDYILSPTVPVQPFEVSSDVPFGSGAKSWPEWSSFSFPINLSQQPACSVPCGLSEDGLPIGLQIIGGRGEDASVLSFALTYEQMYPERFIRSNEHWKSVQESIR